MLVKEKRSNIFKKMLLAGAVLGILFWFFESALHAFVFHEGHFSSQFFSPPIHEIWMRSFGVGILLVFGAYAQFMIAKYEKAQEEIKFAYTQLNQIFNTAADGMRVVLCDINSW